MSGALTKEQLDRAEELERKKRSAGESWSDIENAELEHLKDLARSLTGPAEVADDPRTLLTDEARRPNLDGTDYLEQQQAQSAREREAAIRKGFHDAFKLLEPVALAFLKGLLDRGIEQAGLPPSLLPVVQAAEAAALDAAGKAVKDVAG